MSQVAIDPRGGESPVGTRLLAEDVARLARRRGVSRSVIVCELLSKALAEAEAATAPP